MSCEDKAWPAVPTVQIGLELLLFRVELARSDPELRSLLVHTHTILRTWSTEAGHESLTTSDDVGGK